MTPQTDVALATAHTPCGFADGSDVAAQATLALCDWSRIVGAAPTFVGREDHAKQLEGLAGWYQRVSSDVEFADPPPVGGLDALVDELTGATSEEAFRRLGRARWAVRVAEDLVRVRACATSDAPPATARVALSRLELALLTAQRQLPALAGSPAEVAQPAQRSGSTEGVDVVSCEEGP